MVCDKVSYEEMVPGYQDHQIQLLYHKLELLDDFFYLCLPF